MRHIVLVLLVGLSACTEVSEVELPLSCIEVRGPATDKAEHDWSSACAAGSATWGYHASTSHMQCIESACIAFRGMP